MNNKNAEQLIDTCIKELEKIAHFKEAFGSATPMMALITKYAVIKSCGTIEQCFKVIIFDYFETGSAIQAKNFIEKAFKKSSMNPNLDNIYTSLNKFDAVWKENFKDQLDVLNDISRIKSSLDSLNKNRNAFAHGNNITTSFDQVKIYFEDSCKIIEVLDNVVT